MYSWSTWEKWAVSHTKVPQGPQSLTQDSGINGECTPNLGEAISCGQGQSCPSVLGLQVPEHRALGKSPEQTQIPPGKGKGTREQRQRPRGTWTEVTREESSTSLSSWVRTSSSGVPSASRSGTWSKGLRMEAFLLKLLEWFHRVSPKTKHTSLGAGPRSPSTLAWQTHRHSHLDMETPARGRLQAGAVRAQLLNTDMHVWKQGLTCRTAAGLLLGTAELTPTLFLFTHFLAFGSGAPEGQC